MSDIEKALLLGKCYEMLNELYNADESGCLSLEQRLTEDLFMIIEVIKDKIDSFSPPMALRYEVYIYRNDKPIDSCSDYYYKQCEESIKWLFNTYVE